MAEVPVPTDLMSQEELEEITRVIVGALWGWWTASGGQPQDSAERETT